MKNRVYLWLGLPGFAGLAVFLLAGGIISPDLLGPCGETVKSEVCSPGGRYLAVVKERDCGATTDFSTVVSVHRSLETLSENDQDTLFVAKGEPKLSLLWRSAKCLEISSAGAEVFRARRLWKDVRIVYLTLPGRGVATDHGNALARIIHEGRMGRRGRPP